MCLLSALLLSVAPSFLKADNQTASEKSRAQKREEFRKKLEEFKKLNPEERAAKRKELREKTEKRLAELRKKKADGAITAKEERQLQRLEAAQKNTGETPAPAPQPHDKSKHAPPKHEKAQ